MWSFVMYRHAFVPAVFAALCCLPAWANPPVQTDRAPPPAPHCFNAREVREARQSDAQTLAVRLNDESRYRIELADACPDALWSDRPALVSRHGWVCGSNEEYVDLGDRHCVVSGLARIDAREYAEHALRSQRRAKSNADIVATIEVRAQRRRGFAGTTANCLDTRHMRGWREDGSDIVVEMSPRRSGGNRYYRVEFGGHCSEMNSMNHMRLESAIGGNVVCGNVGDRAVFFRDDNRAPESEPFLRRIQESRLAARFGCHVSLVYPILADDEARTVGVR
jgi:hypothetical protein